MVLSGIIKKFVFNKTLVYTAIGQEQYFQIVDRLASNGIKFSTKSPFDIRSQNCYTQQNRIYDIYVSKEDEGKAMEAIHNFVGDT